MTCTSSSKTCINTTIFEKLRSGVIIYVTSEGTYPFLDEAEREFRQLLRLSPGNLSAACQLLDILFTFSGLSDAEVADVADNLASKAEQLLLDLRALQIRALVYGDQHVRAQQVCQEWSARFPKALMLGPPPVS